MKIQYLGHSCFALTDSAGTRIVTDPYSGIGFSLPRNLIADGVTVSHFHADHNNVSAVGGNPKVFEKEGDFSLNKVKLSSFCCFHDDRKGTLRGRNLVFRMEMDGINVVHAGDLGEHLSPALLEKFKPCDVLLLPVGGYYTIGPKEAKEYVDALSPSVVIPMHYKVDKLNLPITGVECFTSLFEGGVQFVGSEVAIERPLPSQTEIFVMERNS